MIVTDPVEFLRLTKGKPIIWANKASLAHTVENFKFDKIDINIETIRKTFFSVISNEVSISTGAIAQEGQDVNNINILFGGAVISTGLNLNLGDANIGQFDYHWYIVDEKLIDYIKDLRLFEEIAIINRELDNLKILIKNDKVRFNKQGKVERK